jgi:adenosylhomocysteinase
VDRIEWVIGRCRLLQAIGSMDLGFALQARCLEAVARGAVGADSCVVPVPREIDEQLASSFVASA